MIPNRNNVYNNNMLLSHLKEEENNIQEMVSFTVHAINFQIVFKRLPNPYSDFRLRAFDR